MSMLNDEQSHQQDLHEQKLLKEATPIVKDFERVRILEQMCDQQSIVVAETLLVTRKNKPNLRYALRIVELRSEPALRAALHEIEILKKLGQHQSIMGLFLAFRHRQYVGLLQPAFFSLRDRIDLTYRFKKSQGDYRIFFRDPNTSRPLAEAFSNKRSLTCLKKIGVFERNSVVYILREILLALDFLNAKNYVHTQICSSSVFVNERCAVKLGSLLHCRRIGSKNWQFTGNPNRLPPEAFFDQTFVDKDPQLRIKPDFDTWAMGLLALEMVTGKRMRYSRDEMQELAIKFRNYTEQPPTLEETDPKTVVDGKQVYDPDITNFLAQCFVVDHIKRKNPARFRNHPFLSRPINADEGKVWIAVEPRDESPWNTGRSLYIDMLTVHSYYAQIKEDLMSTLSVAIKLIRDGKCFPIFDENLGEGLVRGKYVAVDASLAFVLEEEHDWSRDVLNVSNASTPGKVAMPVLEASKTPDASGEQIRRGKGTGLAQHRNKDCQRVELIFFVNRDWSVVNRRLYISLQFVRWFVRELITFTDLIRVVDELDDILIDYMISHEPRPFSPYKNKQRTSPPDSVAFVTGLRRSLIDPQSNDDPETHRFNNIYIDVALKPELVRKKKAKLDRLRQGDAVAYPNMMGPLWASATFYDLNMDRLNRLEAMLLGQKRIEEWDFDANVKEEDTKESAQENELTTLLKMRRKNPNLAVSSDIEPALSNEARRAKLWGDYTRDFMYRVAKYAVPYQLDNKMARKLYGSPSPTMMSVERLSGPSFDDIDMQLARTRSKQEEDTAETFKIHDDPEQREAMVRRQLREKDEQIRNLEEQMQQLMMGTSQQQGMAPQSPAPPRMEEVDDDLSRLPKHNPKT